MLYRRDYFTDLKSTDVRSFELETIFVFPVNRPYTLDNPMETLVFERNRYKYK